MIFKDLPKECFFTNSDGSLHYLRVLSQNETNVIVLKPPFMTAFFSDELQVKLCSGRILSDNGICLYQYDLPKVLKDYFILEDHYYLRALSVQSYFRFEHKYYITLEPHEDYSMCLRLQTGEIIKLSNNISVRRCILKKTFI